MVIDKTFYTEAQSHDLPIDGLVGSLTEKICHMELSFPKRLPYESPYHTLGWFSPQRPMLH